jgi:dihydrofolate reductase
MRKIRLIAAIDSKRGVATDKEGIPWDLSIDKKYFRDKTNHKNILMGYNTYREFREPLPTRQNFVLDESDEPLREGFIKIKNMETLFKQLQQDIWVIGGAGMYKRAMPYANEIYLTQIDKNFHCDKFFPEYREKFRRKTQSPDHHQNGLTFRFEVWERIKSW